MLQYFGDVVRVNLSCELDVNGAFGRLLWAASSLARECGFWQPNSGTLNCKSRSSEVVNAIKRSKHPTTIMSTIPQPTLLGFASL